MLLVGRAGGERSKYRCRVLTDHGLESDGLTKRWENDVDIVDTMVDSLSDIWPRQRKPWKKSSDTVDSVTAGQGWAISKHLMVDNATMSTHHHRHDPSFAFSYTRCMC